MYHAHMHIVPLPSRVQPSHFLGERSFSGLNVSDALAVLTNSRQYLLFGDEQEVAFGDVDRLGFLPPSQYLRRRLTEHFALDHSWNWRDVSGPEPELMASLALFGEKNVSQLTCHPT